MQKKPPYKSPSNQWYTRALFWDLVIDLPVEHRNDNLDPVFTLYEDKPGYINARKTFVALNDPTGYKWAMHYLGDYNHWKALMKCKWFQEAVDEWKIELELKLQSEAIEVLRVQMRGENPVQAQSAAKYLAEGSWNKHKRGRPSKEEVERQTKIEASKRSEENEDLRRIGLVK